VAERETGDSVTETEGRSVREEGKEERKKRVHAFTIRTPQQAESIENFNAG